jgi:hypothetical protein
MPDPRNVAAGFQLISGGMQQIQQSLLLPQRLEEMKLDQEYKEARLEAQKAGLQVTKDQVALNGLGRLGDLYQTEGVGSQPEFFGSHQKNIEKWRSQLGWSDDEAKHFIKQPAVRFRKTKDITLKGLRTLSPLVGNIDDPDAAGVVKELSELDREIAKIDDPDAFKQAIAQRNQVFNGLTTLLSKRRKQKTVTDKETIKASNEAKDELNKHLTRFEDKNAKGERDQMKEILAIKELLKRGDLNSAFELSKTLFVKAAGDPKPSDADLRRINPNPDWISNFQRIFSKGIIGSPLPKDVDELRFLVDGLEDGIQSSVRKKINNYVESRKGVLKNVKAKDLRQSLNSAFGFSIDDAQKRQIQTEAVLNAAKRILANENATEDQKAKARAVLKAEGVE